MVPSSPLSEPPLYPNPPLPPCCVLQTSGEAQYTADVPAPAGTLHAAWVTSTEASTRQRCTLPVHGILHSKC